MVLVLWPLVLVLVLELKFHILVLKPEVLDNLDNVLKSAVVVESWTIDRSVYMFCS